LTDPAIHSDDPIFGSTNLGKVGFKQFFKAHDCNAVCKELKLKRNVYQKPEAFSSG
jgi:hypothetical protein